MNTQTLSHIRHIARSHQCTLRALRAREQHKTIAQAVAAIPGTRSSARAEYDAAADAHQQYLRDCAIGDKRRDAASVTPRGDITERKLHVLRRIMPGWRSVGEQYSGDTSRILALSTDGMAHASTSTSYGDRYSSRCQYSMTDAAHHIALPFRAVVARHKAGIPASVDCELIASSECVRPGIYRVQTVRTVGKKAAASLAWLAHQPDGGWHLARTERAAVIALNRAVRAGEALRTGRITAATCRQRGWCSPGIMRWIADHGIRRNVRQRMRDGVDSRAIARLIARHGGPRDSYDRALLRMAG